MLAVFRIFETIVAKNTSCIRRAFPKYKVL